MIENKDTLTDEKVVEENQKSTEETISNENNSEQTQQAARSTEQRPNKPSYQNKDNKPSSFRQNRDRKPGRFNEDSQFEEKVVTINRVTKVTKGGRHFRFAAVVVIGDHKGRVGFGTGKANEVPDAIKKAVKEAKKDLVKVPMNGTTIPHEVIGHFGAGRVLLKPAKPGTGVIAGGSVRAVIELSGIADVYTKSLGSNTPINMIRATIDGLQQLRTAEQIAKLRNKDLSEL